MAEERPTFGRDMEPTEYDSLWANRLPKDEVIRIPAEDTPVKENPNRGDQGDSGR